MGAALSIVLHSTTDVPVAKLLRVDPPDDLPSAAAPEEDETVGRSGTT